MALMANRGTNSNAQRSNNIIHGLKDKENEEQHDKNRDFGETKIAKKGPQFL